MMAASASLTAFGMLVLMLMLTTGLSVATLDANSYTADQQLNELEVLSDVLFVATSRSKLDCARRCSNAEHCVSFAFVRRSSGGGCRGYSVEPSVGSSSGSSSGARTYTVEASTVAVDPCQNYVILSDDRRYYYGGSSDLCDDVTVGWYRFMSEAGDNRVMAEESYVWYYQCGTDIPLVLDMQGQSQPAVGQQVDARACGPQGCGWATPVTVRRCDQGFFVYLLQPHPECNGAYCTLPQ